MHVEETKLKVPKNQFFGYDISIHCKKTAFFDQCYQKMVVEKFLLPKFELKTACFLCSFCTCSAYDEHKKMVSFGENVFFLRTIFFAFML